MQDRPEASAAPIAWFRPPIARAARNAWLQASGFVGSGALLLGLLRSHGVDFGSPLAPLWIVGLGLVTTGPIWLTARLGRVLGGEAVLSIDGTGVCWREGEAEVIRWRWDDLRAVEVDRSAGDPTLVITGPDGAPWRPPQALEPEATEEAARLIRELRQKAQLGLRVVPRGGVRRPS
jgi:hypothetical protein